MRYDNNAIASHSLGKYPQLFAYIALGQLKTIDAIDGLIAGVKKWAHTDWFEWFCEAMPEIFGSIGPTAIPGIIQLLQNQNLTFDARTNALSYLHSISALNPEERDRCIDYLIETKENRIKNTNAKNKAKRKQAKKSRQKNRRK